MPFWATIGPQKAAKNRKELLRQSLIWRRERDSNPRYRFWPVCSLSRGVPSTTRPPLRASVRFYWPLDRPVKPNAMKTRRASSVSRRQRRLLELERTMQNAHSELEIFFVDDHRGLDFRRRNHLD